MTFRLNRLERFALLLGAALLALGAGLYFYGQRTTADPAGIGGDFTLQGADGPVSLADFRGQAVVMLFGYTACPDVCPASLANVGAALERLTATERARVQALFISVDPDRDSPRHLKEYCEYFHPDILGLTGTRSEIDAVVAKYGAFYRRVAAPGSALGYSVDHSARLYLIGPAGRVRKRLYHDSPPAELAEGLRALL